MKFFARAQKSIFFAAVICLATVSLPLNSYAAPTSADDYTVLAPLPCIPTQQQTDASGIVTPAVKCPQGDMQNVPTVNFETYVQYAVNLLIALAAVASVFMIVWGGFEYMTTGSFQGKSDGIKRVTNAVYGLLLVLASYLILRTIDPRLVQIPTTFVPKLVLKNSLTTNSAASFFDQLASQADQYKVDTAQSVADREAAKAQVSAYQTQLDAVNQKISAGLDDPTVTDEELSQLSAERQNLLNKINDAKATQSYSTYKAAIDGTMNGLTNSHDAQGNIDLSNNNLTTIKNSLTLTEKAYNEGVAALTAAGDPQDKKQALTNEYNYVHGELEIMKFVNTPGGDPNQFYSATEQQKVNIQNRINALSSDPVKQQSLQAMFDSVPAFKPKK